MRPPTPFTVPAALAGTAAAALTTLAAPAVHACGGFFCQQVVVDQSAERILFELPDDGTVSITVEISYTGAADEFSWVIPVSDTPELSVVPASALRMLDAATAPRIIPPPMAGDFPTAEDGGVDDDGGGEVIVEDLPQVGPYDPTVVSSEDPDALVDWLNTNGYLITGEMEPFVDNYVAGGMKFLAMKLADGTSATDIQPIRMTYPGDTANIPLILTAVAAEPEMSFIVFTLGAQRMGSTNYVNLLVDDSLLQANPFNGQNNYFPLIAWQADEAGGNAFFTEYADDSATIQDIVNYTYLDTEDAKEARAHVLDLLERFPYLTRLYTRLSNWEMAEDPLFGPVEGGDVSNIHDLSGHPEVVADEETGDVAAVECGETYCGAGGRCATTEGSGDGCLCAEGAVGRAVNAPRVGGAGPMATVACQRRDFDLMASIAEETAAVCAGYSCGEGGSCVVLNAVPHCACAAGYAAVNVSGRVTCAKAVEAYGPEQLLWTGFPGGDYNSGDDPLEDGPSLGDDNGEPANCGACDTGSAASGSLGVLAFLVLGAATRRARTRPMRA